MASEAHQLITTATFSWQDINGTQQPTNNCKSKEEIFGILHPHLVKADIYLTPIWYIIGSFGNTISAIIWIKTSSQRNTSAVYLAALSLQDLLFLVLHFIFYSNMVWNLNLDLAICIGIIPLYSSALNFNSLLVLAFTAERWIAVCRPFWQERYCTLRTTIIVLVLLALISMVISTPMLLCYEINIAENSCNLRPGIKPNIWKSYIIATELIMFMSIPVVILVLNSLVIREIKTIATRQAKITSSKEKESNSTTILLLFVSFYIIACEVSASIVFCLDHYGCPKDCLILEIVEENQSSFWWYTTFQVYKKVIYRVVMSRHACAIFLYLVHLKTFREDCWNLFRRKSSLRGNSEHLLQFQMDKIVHNR